MARSEKAAARQQRDAGVRERWTAERREQIAVYFLQVYATSHTSTLELRSSGAGYRRTRQRKHEDRTGNRRCTRRTDSSRSEQFPESCEISSGGAEFRVCRAGRFWRPG